MADAGGVGAGREAVNEAGQRRLVIRPGAMGDFIVSLPAIESLRSGYLEVWAAAPNVPLARFADCARPISSTGLELLGITGSGPRLIEHLRSFDAIISWYGANRPEFRALVESLGLRFHFLPALPPEGTGVHAVDYYLRQTAALGGLSRPAVPQIAAPARRREGAVIHPFSGSKSKNWPLARFCELARALESRLPVAWCAGPEQELPGAIRIENLYELGCRLAEARLFIGNDSGVAHLAAAVGTPVVAVFGPTDPAVWAPRGDAVRVVRGEDMAAITVSDALAAAFALLEVVSS
jgi:heptosyltransferase III